MTRRLEEVINKVGELPDAEQDMAAKDGRPVRLDEETRAAIREGREQARRGEFVSDDDLTAFFERHGIKRTYA